MDYFNHECAYCGLSTKEHLDIYKEEIHQEHFIPLSKGGGYTESNIIPACKSCNSSKSNQDFFEWYKIQGFHSKKREERILSYLKIDNEELNVS